MIRCKSFESVFSAIVYEWILQLVTLYTAQVRALIAAGGVARQGGDGITDGFDVNATFVALHLAVLRDESLSYAVNTINYQTIIRKDT
jgi:hypothetical protein